ncbi:hypothetical protein GCM10012287_10000 [Streptomyces daqingensis]|uniref:Cell division protein FtsW n=1 Tax=Streptomyces daqingensis TaxID=1472640 RepID=A0ABQ2LXN1_9ACTN|nr:hypothetical protein [Streptomyces daqingensis]GGO44421.1 hypothetical protein GCM10012287_10000 [Streptomyces daqingensis]
MSTHRRKKAGGPGRAGKAVNRKLRPPSLNGGRRAELVMFALVALTIMMIAASVVQLS